MTSGEAPRPVRSGRAGREHVRVERSAGGVVLRRIADEVHVLLILDPYENWGLPKGHLEKGESPREAAVREVREETGLASLRLGREVGAIDWYFRHRGRLIHKFCTFFLMSSPRGEAAPAVAEGITVCRWVPLSDAVDDISYDNAREVLERAVAALEGDVDVAADLFTED